MSDYLIDSLMHLFVEVSMVVDNLLQLLLLLLGFLPRIGIVQLFKVVHSLIFSHLRALKLDVLCEFEVFRHFPLLLLLHLLVLGSFGEFEVPLLFLPALLHSFLHFLLPGENSICWL